MRQAVHFLLNGQLRRLEAFDPTLTVLRYLRETEALLGTKEGCAEGDCGACTAVVADLHEGQLRYRAVNSCIQFVAQLDGKALFTVEALQSQAGLHPVQQAMVDCHGSQCGFCTPGFVMSMYAGSLNGVKPQRQAINEMLAGNLCRCTGYTPIIEAATRVLSQAPQPACAPAALQQQLEALPKHEGFELEYQGRRFIAPANSEELAQVLQRHPDATLLAGGTDVGLFVTKQHRSLATVVHLEKIPELSQIRQEGGGVRIGAAVSYQRARSALSRLYPALDALVSRVGAVQVRSMGTVGGNIGNGSPIGDMPPALIAAGAQLTLRCGSEVRSLPLEDYFIAYGKQNRQVGEWIESIWVPEPPANAVYRVYKITKRFEQDISSVCGAFNIGLLYHGDIPTVESARICFGGMAGTPLRATGCERWLVGRPWNAETIEQAAAILGREYTPLSDFRASAEYRSLVAANLLRRLYAQTVGQEDCAIAC
ncbi:xanthine dehydrogenase small subunit [Pusillimonas sp. CC-YST705]|uniref:Xanthine dehydrogenase small subunit n=1 Tax=Mesopusillimonas faecipullorum TaxID=2755040 RepID=A0ABS8CAF1_9BURK|nr:xanthine dehydrogenase small subunit [Mesopusillimonas faecipullorum]MCB5363011.1 xanthine dehydrogenase small subunit [Mesopusillimonas faecipullorum]